MHLVRGEGEKERERESEYSPRAVKVNVGRSLSLSLSLSLSRSERDLTHTSRPVITLIPLERAADLSLDPDYSCKRAAGLTN